MTATAKTWAVSTRRRLNYLVTSPLSPRVVYEFVSFVRLPNFRR
jgi:hypothetical protein